MSGFEHARCVTPQARALETRPPKLVHHRCGVALLTKVTLCWGPSLDGKGALQVTKVTVAYWDAQTREPVYECPGCGGVLQFWWDYKAS